MSFAGIGIELAERGLLPDALIRKGIRDLCVQRIKDCVPSTPDQQQSARKQFAEQMRAGSVAPVPELANEQHYEVPQEFFGYALGHRRKYSGFYWPDGCSSLDQAEDAALKATCERAELEDG
ncbi:MAG: class I SAM-dependent methyltransferase, partial [Phycisphaerales bacterium]|nr:class I SAM-dependent methyltransferase [Phycisphaerales bacterium]